MPIHHQRSLIARTLKTLLLPLLCLCFQVGSAHAQSACGPQFLAGQAPVLINPALAQNAHMLCYEIYAIADSGVTRTPLWSAEHLTSDEVLAARQQPRVDAFHPEMALPASERSEREDYVGSGLDQGHMTPSGDAPNPRAQFETFSLGNAVPQDPDNNRHLWQGIEIATRGLARYDRELYVVTGPAFVGPRGLIRGRVSVPTHIWKAIYDPRRGAAAYITLNRPGFLYAEISIAELTRITGVDPFPALPPAVKATAMLLKWSYGYPLGKRTVGPRCLNRRKTTTAPDTMRSSDR